MKLKDLKELKLVDVEFQLFELVVRVCHLQRWVGHVYEL